MLMDAHCHLTGSGCTPASATAALDRAQAVGVAGCIAVTGEFTEAEALLALAAQDARVQVCLGVHPHEASRWNAEVQAQLARWAAEPHVRFVGEAGLDWHYDYSPREAQEAAFRGQIALARQLGKPLMIHTRSAGDATLQILREEGASHGVIHCFSEDLAFARQALDLGFYLSFSGIVTFPKALSVQEVAAWAPLDRILVETDSPYLAPVPFRGKTNEPAHVIHVAAAVARLRGLAPEAVAEATSQNLEALCGWLPSAC